MPSTKVPIKVQKRSGSDWSHHNALSQQIGVITPVCVNEVIPNTKVYLRFALAGSMPPMATDAYAKVYYDIRAFFVPFRLLSGSFESWFSDYEYPAVKLVGGVNSVVNQKCDMPYFTFDYNGDFTDIFGRGTLADYLGVKKEVTTAETSDFTLSALPFLAYHKVCNDWFRQPNITKEYFARPDYFAQIGQDYPYMAAMLPYITLESGSVLATLTLYANDDLDALQFKLADGESIFRLRSANYDYDYFTNALPNAQLGSPMSVNTTGNSFTISDLRAMNSLQQFAEINMLAGSNLVDVVAARYGAHLSRGVAQRCIYLGGSRIDMSTKSVEITGNADSVTSQNPFKDSVGAAGGRVFAHGTNVIIDNFTAEEPGYIFVVGVILPKVTYGSGVRRYLKHYIGPGSITDMGNPLLQNVGNQPIYNYELTGALGYPTENNIFGYTDRYAEFMTMEDEVHGELAFGGSMDSFVAQRVFSQGSTPTITTNFLEVPTTSLDNITAVSGDLSKFGFYGQFAFEFKVSQPLGQYSLPSLQNPAYEHGKTVVVHRGGFRF